MRPWARACVVVFPVWLVAGVGIETASASGPGADRRDDAARQPLPASGPQPGATAPAGRRTHDARGVRSAIPSSGDSLANALQAATGTTSRPAQASPDLRLPAGAARAIALPVATGAPTSRFAQASPDFRFGQPRFSVAFRGLQLRPRATGELHSLLRESFFVRTGPEDDPLDPTAGRMNFDATGVGFDIGFGAGSRLETRVGVDYALVRALTEDRYNEDEFGLPIEQDTELAQWSVHGELALALMPRGRAIGQYVWIPSAVVPYVGAGAGFFRYSTVMDGRFVDVIDFTIFSERIESQGWAPSVHAFGGVDFRLTRNVLLTTEARYAWATAELDGVLAGFEHDLTGLRISAGVRFVF